ncbi:ParB/RepB/Spo0J family partition protein [Telmatospirillum sp. J64-1]|uniref:ParB/RepB/Spo0J family partition protein n=1 Tax=Telmatospirillum sp. J64-1 TaxID=2502183 RepID=UPI00115DEF7C|nr:ParB/RepB/Spo0J family partition protein [Telmatospirillum sp. J64-1]
MSSEDGKRRLGRGLSALFGDPEPTAVAADMASAPSEEGEKATQTLPIELLRPGKFQPRMRFDEDRIADLVESIRDKGIIQPILVRRDPADPAKYEIIAGERRWRAAQRAQLHQVPVLIKDLTDREAAEVALVENLQRQDLSAIEEAEGYRRLQTEFEHSQEDLARAVGKSRSHVANTMRLLALPDPVKEMVESGQLSAGHARALLTSQDAVTLARHVVAKGLNVRQTEKLVQKGPGKSRPRKSAEKDPDTAALERDLTNLLGTKVDIKFQGKGGELTIHYGSLEQLDSILKRLSQGHVTAKESGEDLLEDGELSDEDLAADLDME